MNERLCLIEPADTFLARDGTPFNQDDEGAARANAIFPPPPATVHGALRVAIARALGWSGGGNWNDASAWRADAQASHRTSLKTIGTCRTGASAELRLCGPFVLRAQAELLFSAPRNLRLIKSFDGKDKHFVRLEPAFDLGATDLAGMSGFLAAPASDIASGESVSDFGDALVDCQMIAFALGCTDDPGKATSLTDVFANENRVGLARDDATRLAISGQLYQTARHRLRKGYSLAALATGLGEGIELCEVVPFGSENRPASVTSGEADAIGQLRQPDIDLMSANGGARWTMLFLTPLAIASGKPVLEALQEIASSHNGKLVSAAISRIGLRGSFQTPVDSRDGKGRSVQAPVIPAGSLLYIEGGEPPLVGGSLPQMAGVDTHMGYGRFLVGRWGA